MTALTGITKLSGITKFKPSSTVAVGGYDVFLIAGQSNTHYGHSEQGDTVPDATLDGSDIDIFMWDRDLAIPTTATEPLDHPTQAYSISDKVGFALTFAKWYKANGYLGEGRDILLVAEGTGATGFANNNWNPGDALYNTAIANTDLALAYGSGTNTLKGILWHQGEKDAQDGNTAGYESDLDAMIDALRTKYGATVPFVAGGMVPYWRGVNGNTSSATKEAINDIIVDLPSRKTYTGYASPDSPTTIAKDSPTTESNHFSNRGQRGTTGRSLTDVTTLGMAGRYATAYIAALSNN